MEKLDMIKHKEKIRLAMLHIALICGIVMVTAGILDWYNPYMNFTGQIRPLAAVQVCDLVALALTAENPQTADVGKRNQVTYRPASRHRSKRRR